MLGKVKSTGLAGAYKDLRALSKSRKGNKRMTLKMQEQIKKEKKTPASIEKQAERNARRKAIGHGEGPKLRWQGVRDKVVGKRAIPGSKAKKANRKLRTTLKPK